MFSALLHVTRIAAFALIALPWLFLVTTALFEDPSSNAVILSARQFRLLSMTLGACALSATLALLLGAIISWLFMQMGTRPARQAAAVTLLLALALSPMLYAFGIQRLLTMTGGSPYPLSWTVTTWTLWGWPFATAILVAGLANIRAREWAIARLWAPPGAAFRVAALPRLIPFALVAWLLLFAIFSTEYTLPHAWGLVTYITELLSWSSSSRLTRDTLIPALPLCGVGFATSITILLCIRRIKSRWVRTASQTRPRESARWPIAAAAVTFYLAPVAGLTLNLGWPDLMDVFRIYGWDWILAIATVGCAASVASAMALGLSLGNRNWLYGIWLISLAGAFFPGALSGKAVSMLYSTFTWSHDHPIKFLAGLICRFGWIPLTMAVFETRFLASATYNQVRADGAGAARAFLLARGPRLFPLLLTAALLFTGQALADVATMTHVQVSSFRPVSLVLIESMHRFEDQVVGAAGLFLALAGIIAAMICFLLVRLVGKALGS